MAGREPEARVGILGGGQLGRMLAQAGYPMGVHCRLFDARGGASAAEVASVMKADYGDEEALDRFSRRLDAVTYEFENVPAPTAEWLAQRLPVRPGAAALEVAQDRLPEKTFFQDHGIPTAPFVMVDTRAELGAALEEVGVPAILKTRRFGYDGKGQFLIEHHGQADAAWDEVGGAPLILEGHVRFRRELSILSVRSGTGEARFYPLVQNEHEDGILRRSRAPAPGLTAEAQERAERYAAALMDSLDYVGVLAVELFDTEDGLLANEMAPRVHNSGHWTIEGAETSQFQNHLRAVLGWPLGETAVRGHAAMVNLIGGVPPIREILAIGGAHVHLYGKQPRPGRKVGHVTVRADDPGRLDDALDRLRTLVARYGEG